MQGAFIGLGNMGGPMATNIVKAGHNLTVWNRTAEVMEPVVAAGARGASSIQDAVQDAEIIGICVSTPDVVRALVLGANGVLANAKRDAVIVDFSTIDPATSR